MKINIFAGYGTPLDQNCGARYAPSFSLLSVLYNSLPLLPRVYFFILKQFPVSRFRLEFCSEFSDRKENSNSILDFSGRNSELSGPNSRFPTEKWHFLTEKCFKYMKKKSKNLIEHCLYLLYIAITMHIKYIT